MVTAIDTEISTPMTVPEPDGSGNSESEEGSMPGGQRVVPANARKKTFGSGFWCCCGAIAALFASCAGARTID